MSITREEEEVEEEEDEEDEEAAVEAAIVAEGRNAAGSCSITQKRPDFGPPAALLGLSLPIITERLA